MKRGIQDIKDSLWYQGFDWDGVHQKRVKTTFKPAVANDNDTTCFSICTDYDQIRQCSVDEYAYAFADFDVTTH